MKKTIISLSLLILVVLVFCMVKAKEGHTLQNTEDINTGVDSTLATEETHLESKEPPAVTTLPTEPQESIQVAPETSEPTEEPTTAPTVPVVDTEPTESPTQPTEPTPTIPKPAEPKPTEPKPTEPKPTEPQITESEPTIPIESEEPEFRPNPDEDDLSSPDHEDNDHGYCPKCGRHLWTNWDRTGCFTFLSDTTCDCGTFVKAGQCHHH